ncbi:MAG: hypothetical protein ACRCWR_12940 [Saezia sp.]
MKKIGKTIVPRNPYAVAANQKKAGKHEDNPKAERQKSKQNIREEVDGEKTNSLIKPIPRS